MLFHGGLKRVNVALLSNRRLASILGSGQAGFLALSVYGGGLDGVASSSPLSRGPDRLLCSRELMATTGSQLLVQVQTGVSTRKHRACHQGLLSPELVDWRLLRTRNTQDG
eukprot:12011960-Alexandrium_andersonii.AAC.1